MKSSTTSLGMRALLATPLLAGAALLLGACGDASGASNTTALQLSSTDYQTIAPVESTSTTTIAGQTPGQVTPDVTEYTVQSGDVPVNVAKKFGVTLDALNLANADTAGYSGFYVGLVIKIPAGATIPDESATTTTVAGATPAQTTTTTIAGGGDNCAPGSYVIEDGDIPSKVAEKFDVTLAQLDAANVNTKGYKSFIVGITIVIPAKSDC